MSGSLMTSLSWLNIAAPIRMISINSSESGLVQCSTRDVYPAPVLQWSSEPASAPGVLQPVTRISPGGNGLFSAQSVLKLQNNSLEHVYMCTITSALRGKTWLFHAKPPSTSSSYLPSGHLQEQTKPQTS